MAGNPEALSDEAIYEWSMGGKHMDIVHRWACEGEPSEDGLTLRVDYLLEVIEGMNDTHREVREWASMVRMMKNCLQGGSVPRFPLEYQPGSSE